MKKRLLFLVLLLSLPLAGCQTRRDGVEPYKEVTHAEFKSHIPAPKDTEHTKATVYLMLWTTSGVAKSAEVHLVTDHNHIWVCTDPITYESSILIGYVQSTITAMTLRFVVDRDWFLPDYCSNTKYYYSPTQGFLFVSPNNDITTYAKWETTDDLVTCISPTLLEVEDIKSVVLTIAYLD